MKGRRRWVAIEAVAVLVAAATWVAVALEIPQAVHDRMSGPLVIGSAQFEAPDLLHWPRMSHDAVAADCELCARTSKPAAASTLTLRYGWLIKDSDLTSFETNVPNRPRSAADVPLPRMAWVLLWPDDCWAINLSGVGRCASYELIDDSTGWILADSQISPP